MMALGIIGMGLSLVGSISQAQSQAQAAQYQAAVDRNNALASQRMAAYEVQAGEAKEQDQDLQSRAQIGKIVADQAASGLDVNSGSPQAVAQGSTEIARLNTLRTAQNASLKAAQDVTQSNNYIAQSQLDESRASSDMTAGIISGFSSVIGGIGGMAQKGMLAV